MRRPALALLLGCLLLVAGASAIDGYDYYQTIEYAACDQEIYQQDIVIHRSTGTAYNETAGGLETWHIYVGDHCQADYDDVRFTNSTGDLAYYLWPDYNSSSARFAVRMEGADAAGEMAVWYGNAAATTTSDGDATYDWFSDDLEEWSSTGIPYRTGTGSIDSDGGIHITSTNTNGISWPTVSALDPTGKRIEILTTLNSHASSNSQFRLQITDNISSDPGATNGVYHSRSDVQCYFGISSTLVGTALPFDTTTPRKYAFTTTANAKLWIDDDLKLTLSNSVPNYSGKYLSIWVYNYAEATISYVLIRAYSATPPAALTFSGEQEAAAPPITAFTATPAAGLAPLAVQFTDASTGGPTSWSWSFGDGGTSTAQNPQHTYTVPGTYTVTLTATNEYGSTPATKLDYITVYGPITAQFTTNITGGTAPLTVQFTDRSTGSPTSWAWTFGDGNTSTAQNPQHTYTTAGTHTVTLNASHPYDNDTETKTAYITVAVLQPFPGLTSLPRDLTGTGLYTDINGNNRLDYNDLTIFFQNLAWAKTAQPIACFDFNGNGWLDYNDVITLFSTIMEEHT